MVKKYLKVVYLLYLLKRLRTDTSLENDLLHQKYNIFNKIIKNIKKM